MNRALLRFTAACALVGCGPQYREIELTVRNQPPIPIRISGDEIELPVGIAVSVHAEVFSATRLEYTDEDVVDLISQDRDVLLAEATAGERNFVLVGAAIGETCLSVEVNFEEQECIPVKVIAPE